MCCLKGLLGLELSSPCEAPRASRAYHLLQQGRQEHAGECVLTDPEGVWNSQLSSGGVTQDRQHWVSQQGMCPACTSHVKLRYTGQHKPLFVEVSAVGRSGRASTP